MPIVEHSKMWKCETSIIKNHFKNSKCLDSKMWKCETAKIEKMWNDYNSQMWKISER